MIGCADMVKMLVAEDHHVNALGRDSRDARGRSSRCGWLDERPTSIKIVRDWCRDEIGVGGAILEADLIDIGARLDQRAGLAFQQGLEWGGTAVAHGLAAPMVCRWTRAAACQRIHDHQRKGRLLADQIDEAGVVDPHDAGVGRRRSRSPSGTSRR